MGKPTSIKQPASIKHMLKEVSRLRVEKKVAKVKGTKGQKQNMKIEKISKKVPMKVPMKVAMKGPKKTVTKEQSKAKEAQRRKANREVAKKAQVKHAKASITPSTSPNGKVMVTLLQAGIDRGTEMLAVTRVQLRSLVTEAVNLQLGKMAICQAHFERKNSTELARVKATNERLSHRYNSILDSVNRIRTKVNALNAANITRTSSKLTSIHKSHKDIVESMVEVRKELK